jgi:hypothetical protein
VRTWFDDAGHRRISHWSCSRSTSTACRRFGPYSRWQLLTGGFAPPLWRDHRHGKRSQGHPSGDVATFLKKPVDPFVVATAVDEAVRRLRWGTLTRTIPLADRRSFRGVPTVLGASAPRPVDFERLFRGELLGVGTQQVQKTTKRRPLMTPDVVFLAIFATSLSSIYLRREISNSMCFRCEGSSPPPARFVPAIGRYISEDFGHVLEAEGIEQDASRRYFLGGGGNYPGRRLAQSSVFRRSRRLHYVSTNWEVFGGLARTFADWIGGGKRRCGNDL